MKGRKPHPVHLRRFDNSCKSQPVKSTARYVFPDIGDRTIAYLGRRFMATELTAQAPWDRTDDCSSEVTSKQFDYLLLDGIDCAEFAGLKKLDDGSLLGSLLDIGGGAVFSSIREAVTTLAKECATYVKSPELLKNFEPATTIAASALVLLVKGGALYQDIFLFKHQQISKQSLNVYVRRNIS
jgi:hypothetical protein